MKIQTGQVAVITGGASGIGLALARALGRRGVVVAIADVRAEALEAAQSELRASDIHASTFAADVTSEASVQALAQSVREELGPVDLLCNNAGVVAPEAPMWDQTSAAWDRAIDIKIRGVIHGVRAFVPTMVERGVGHVVNTASSAGLAPLPGRSPYTGSMHAVVGLTETLDAELKRVSSTLGATVLCPGLVATPLGQNSAALGAIELPDELTTPAGLARMQEAFRDALSADEVAETTLQAVEAGRVHTAPGTGVLERAQGRIEQLLADLDAERSR